MPDESDKLFTRRQRFPAEYVKDLCGRRAAIRAGYAPQAASAVASELLKDPAVTDEIARLQADAFEAAGLSAELVLREAMRIAFFDPAQLYDPKTGALLPIHQMPEDARRAIASIKTKELYADDGVVEGQLREVKLIPKDAALDKLMRHLGLLKDVIRHEVTLEELVKSSMAPKPGEDDGGPV